MDTYNFSSNRSLIQIQTFIGCISYYLSYHTWEFGHLYFHYYIECGVRNFKSIKRTFGKAPWQAYGIRGWKSSELGNCVSKLENGVLWPPPNGNTFLFFFFSFLTTAFYFHELCQSYQSEWLKTIAIYLNHRAAIIVLNWSKVKVKVSVLSNSLRLHGL